jgi:hypothetical protein
MKNIVRVVAVLFLVAGIFSCAQKNAGTAPPEPVNGKVMIAEVYPDLNDACPLCMRYVQICLIDENGPAGFGDALVDGFTQKSYAVMKGKIPKSGKPDPESVRLYAELAKKSGVKYLVMPVLYCWGERRGSALSSSQPARVGFHLHIYDPETGKEIWGGDFNEWQEPLNENILDVQTFISRGGKWVTAQELAKEGVLKLIDQFQKAQEKSAADTRN